MSSGNCFNKRHCCERRAEGSHVNRKRKWIRHRVNRRKFCIGLPVESETKMNPASWERDLIYRIISGLRAQGYQKRKDKLTHEKFLNLNSFITWYDSHFPLLERNLYKLKELKPLEATWNDLLKSNSRLKRQSIRSSAVHRQETPIV